MNRILYFCFIFLIACNKGDKKTVSYYVDVQNTESITGLFENWQAVTLATNDSALITNIDKIEVNDNYFFILDRLVATIFQFDKNGNFINKIERKGEGPEEYLEISDFRCFDDFIYVLSSVNHTIYKYNMTGSFVESYKLDNYYHRFDFYNKDTIVLYSAFSNEKKYNFCFYDFLRGKIVAKTSPFDKNENFIIYRCPFSDDFLFSNYVYFPYDYSVYKLKIDSCDPVFNLNFNTVELLDKEISFEEKRKYSIGKNIVQSFNSVKQMDSILFVSYNCGGKFYLSKLFLGGDKKSNTYLMNSKEKDYPFCFANPLIFYEDFLISYMPAYAVLAFDEHFHSDKNDLGILDSGDNPVLFFHKLKVN